MAMVMVRRHVTQLVLSSYWLLLVTASSSSSSSAPSLAVLPTDPGSATELPLSSSGTTDDSVTLIPWSGLSQSFWVQIAIEWIAIVLNVFVLVVIVIHREALTKPGPSVWLIAGQCVADMTYCLYHFGAHASWSYSTSTDRTPLQRYTQQYDNVRLTADWQSNYNVSGIEFVLQHNNALIPDYYSNSDGIRFHGGQWGCDVEGFMSPFLCLCFLTQIVFAALVRRRLVFMATRRFQTTVAETPSEPDPPLPSSIPNANIQSQDSEESMSALQRGGIITGRFLLTGQMIVWLISVLLTSYTLLDGHSQLRPSQLYCNPDWRHAWVTIPIVVFVNVQLFLVTVSYWQIVQEMRVVQGSLRGYNTRAAAMETQLIRMMVAVMLTFGAGILPFAVMVMFEAVTHQQASPLVDAVAVQLLDTGPVLNPIIFIGMDSSLRAACLNTFHLISSGCRRCWSRMCTLASSDRMDLYMRGGNRETNIRHGEVTAAPLSVTHVHAAWSDNASVGLLRPPMSRTNPTKLSTSVISGDGVSSGLGLIGVGGRGGGSYVNGSLRVTRGSFAPSVVEFPTVSALEAHALDYEQRQPQPQQQQQQQQQPTTTTPAPNAYESRMQVKTLPPRS